MDSSDINDDMAYLHHCLEVAPLIPIKWAGEDRNLRAFRSKRDLVAWYSQGPGIDGEPYRDRGFYCRELAHLSRTIKPRTVVEFGTSLGIGTCLLRWLNPDADLTTVDCNISTYMPGNILVPIAHIAIEQEIRFSLSLGDSRDYHHRGVDLCFIDGDHSYAGVENDSWQAMRNHSTDHRWAIIWHDYNERHPGVVMAVDEFCETVGIPLQSRPDSDTVWIEGGS